MSVIHSVTIQNVMKMVLFAVTGNVNVTENIKNVNLSLVAIYLKT